eukprot:g19393.t2
MFTGTVEPRSLESSTGGVPVVKLLDEPYKSLGPQGASLRLQGGRTVLKREENKSWREVLQLNLQEPVESLEALCARLAQEEAEEQELNFGLFASVHDEPAPSASRAPDGYYSFDMIRQMGQELMSQTPASNAGAAKGDSQKELGPPWPLETPGLSLGERLRRSSAHGDVAHADSRCCPTLGQVASGQRKPRRFANWNTPSRHLLKSIGPQGWRILQLDHRAHGRSPAGSPPHNLDACALDVLDTLKEAGVRRDAELIVCGHSFGGKVALAVLEALQAQGTPPRKTWIFDSVPGCPAALPAEDCLAVRFALDRIAIGVGGAMKSQSFALSVGVVSRPFARQLAAERIRAARRNAVSKVWALCSKWSNQPPASSLQNVQIS